ncbi:retrovirus-related pol polyprotein from transposon TNT 1-94 [Tanacetum coccineum]
MITYGLCQRTTGYDKIQKNDLWLLSMFDARHQNRDLDTTILRELIDSEGRIIPEDPQPSVPRVGIPRPLKESMQDLYEMMGNMEIRDVLSCRVNYLIIKFYIRCGDPNHLIGDCPKPSHNKDQKAFIGGSWSDNEKDTEDKTNNETCLMAQSSNEVCLRTCLEPDEWIKDSGCSKHMTGNKSLFSTYKAYDGGNGIRKNGLYVMKLGNKSQDKLCLVTVVDKSTLWHRRLGHANMRLIQSLSSKELVRNLPKLKYDKHFCDACKIGKQAHTSHKAKNMVSTKRCLELLHMDLFGPSAIKSYGGNLYTLVVVDDYSRYTWTRFLKTKNEAFEKFEILSRKIQNQLGSSIIAIRTDHGREFDNEVQFGAYCDAQGITHNFSAPRTPQSNGVVERKNRTLQEMSRTMLNEQSIPQKFWCNAVDTSTYILNRILIRPILGKTPYEIFRGRKPSLEYFKVFGSKCFILNTKDYLTKFDPKSYEGVFLGYSQNSKAYVVLNKHTMKVEESLNVTFDESPPPTKLSPLVDDDVGEEEAIRKNTKIVNINNEEDESIEVDEIVNIKESKNHPLDQVIGNLNQRTLRSQAQNHSNFFCFISTIEPKNVNEALKDKSWVVAMQEELNQFVANDVWELVPLPITILESIRILLAIACANDFKLYQMDVNSAFLNGFINEEVYVAQPPGFIDFQNQTMFINLRRLYMVLSKLLKLGLQIKQMKDGIFVNQSKYIKEMLKKFRLEDSKPTKTPMSTEIKLTKDDEADSVDSSKYRGRHIESSFTFGNNIVDQFKSIQFDCLLTLNDHICPRFIIEFYHKFQLIRNVHDMSLSIGFTIRDKEFIMSLEKFGQVLQIPNKGTCVFSKDYSLELLNTTHEKHASYQTNLLNIRDVIKNICIPLSHKSCSNPTIILQDNLSPNIKDWELIVRENVICVDAHKSSIDACSANMLYHLKNSQNFNLAYFIAHKIESVKNRVNYPLPYGLLITRLYRFILARHPKLFHPHHTLQFVLHYRMISSINRKNKRKRNESKKAKLDIPYSPSSVESSNQSSLLLGYRSSVDHF